MSYVNRADFPFTINSRKGYQMRITKDKEIAGLYIRHGKRGDTWNYARTRSGKMLRASLGPTSLFHVAQARTWAHGLSQDAAGVARSFTLQQVADAAVAKAERKKNRQPDYLRYWATLHSSDWLPRPLEEITKAMVNDRHDA